MDSYMLYIKLGLVLSLCGIIFISLLKYRKIALKFNLCKPVVNFPLNKYTYTIIAFAVLSLITLVLMLYASWPKDDEWLLLGSRNMGWKSRLLDENHAYYYWCGRGTEVIGRVLCLSRNMWENWVVTPIVLVSIPFLMKRLCAPTAFRLSSFRGLCFIICSFSLLMLTSPYFYAKYWVNVTYVWTSAAAVFFLGTFRSSSSNNAWCTSITFLAAFFAGWSTECGSAAIGIVFFLLIYLHMRNKKTWSALHLAALIGYLAGAYMKYSSGAARGRAGDVATILTGMSYEQITEYVQNLTWEKVKALKGGCVTSNLKDVPYELRIYFWPYLMEYLTNMAQVAIIATTILIIVALRYLKANAKVILVSVALLALACITASSYLAGAIPYNGSLYPAAFIIFASFCYLLANIRISKYIMGLLSLVLCFMMCRLYLPATYQTVSYIPQRTIRDQELERQALQRIPNIVLPPLPDTERLSEEPARTLVLSNNISDNTEDYTNQCVIRYYQIRDSFKADSVIQLKAPSATSRPDSQ